MGIRRKKIPDSQKNKIKELLDTQIPKEIYQSYHGTRSPISLSEIYKIRQEKQGRQVKESPRIVSKDLVTLVRDWRTRVRFLSLGELLEQYWFGGLCKELRHLIAESESIRKLFDTIQEHHAKSLTGPIRVMLGLEENKDFVELRQLFPKHSVWTLQDQWEKNYGEYIESLSAWCRPIRRALVHVIPDILNSSREQSKAFVEVNLALVGTVVSCDLLLREMGEKPPSLLLYSEADNVRKVRADAISLSSTAVKEFLSKDYDINFIWEREIVIPGTSGLLDKLATLNDTSNHLRATLAELELHVTSN
jgi:hypothetical protein